MRLPASVTRRIVDRSAFVNDAQRFTAMSDAELLESTRTCLRNLSRLDETTAGADADLQLVLVPELWERLQPGTRDDLRRISSSLAEYDPDPARPSIFARLLSAASLERLCTRAASLRNSMGWAASLDNGSLVEWTRFAIAGSRAATHHAPEACVYGSGFTYRLVPAIASRAIARGPRGRQRTP